MSDGPPYKCLGLSNWLGRGHQGALYPQKACPGTKRQGIGQDFLGPELRPLGWGWGVLESPPRDSRQGRPQGVGGAAVCGLSGSCVGESLGVAQHTAGVPGVLCRPQCFLRLTQVLYQFPSHR